MLILLGILLTIFLIIKFADHKSRMELKSQNDAFWQKENQANTTRKVDISGLDYLHIPYEELPFMESEGETLLSLQNTLKSLEDKPILNLMGYSNTDLKLLYGIANINFLTRCDNNFITLIKTLYGWGKELVNLGYKTEARQVLEYGVTIKTDIGKHYLLLGDIYKSLQDYDKIDDLIQAVSELNSSSKETTLYALKELKMSYYVD
ncbi:MAG: hypothetical protein K0S61_1481 [Anaerocolumna sp.]|jgi:tetratricopeptide (TPR) repeat protein|nr:hypothetical protein [Anaerocolumna sp.]